MTDKSASVRLDVEAGVAVVTIDNPPVNATSGGVRRALLDVFVKLRGDHAVKAIVLTGAGRMFAGGADLKEFDRPSQGPSLPDVILAMEACDQPIVAAINGPALGGGFELALACDFRIAHPKALVGLPETKLGFNPGAGGTQRLPRLVGIAKAIDLIGQATALPGEAALKLGMVDAVAEDVVAEAKRRAPGAAKRRLSGLPVPADPSGAIETSIENVTRRARGNAAVPASIALVRAAATEPFGPTVLHERDEFVRLRDTPESKALRHLFFAERAAQSMPDAAPRPIARAAVIGGGLMGSGIAISMSDAGIQVALVERDADAAAATGKRIEGVYAGQVRSGRIDERAAAERRARIDVSDDWSRLRDADLVIEAVFEDMAVKQEVFRRLDGLAKPGAVLASNTSYLDINAIAAVTQRPADVLGMHFFSPANVMRLLEVVYAQRTATDVLATALTLGKRIGKLPVVAGVCDGFIGNRIFTVFRRQADYLIEDGAMPREVDRAMEHYGFAMGPFVVGDLAGLDIGWATRKRRAPTRPPGERYVEIADRICERGWFGRKTGRGWYRYEGGTKPIVDPEIEEIIVAERAKKGITPRSFSDEEIVRRMLAAMVNEGARVLAEGIAQRASDVDLVFVNGYGFPSVKGGPMYAADRRGLANVIRDVEEGGEQPAPLLRDLAARGVTFAQWDAERHPK